MDKRWTYVLSALVAFSGAASASENVINTHVALEGTVVSSTCSLVVEGNQGRVGVIDLGQYNQSTRQGGDSKNFWIKLYETGATSPGCDAFWAGGERVSLWFGDKSTAQLDARGVVTKGAGDQVRLRISSTDGSYVSSVEPLSLSHRVLSYPRSFAVKGIFGFRVQPIGLDTAMTGDYQGELSVVVTYK